MIYLIGGVLKSGKTLIANKINSKKQIPVFSTDFLLWGLGGENGIFSYYDSDKDVSIKLEPILIKIISFLVNNDEDYIIEGTHITIALYEKLKELFNDKVKAVFLGYSNVNKFDKYNEIIFYERNIKNKWYNNISKDDFISLINEKINESNNLKDICNKKNYIYFDVDNVDLVTKEIMNSLFGM